MTFPLFASTPSSPLRSTGFAAIACAAMLLLAGCGEHNAPVVNTEPPAPIVQGNQIRFAPDHPQLKLLGVVPATAAKRASTCRAGWSGTRSARSACSLPSPAASPTSGPTSARA